jgi:hypothetical protein
MLFRAFKLDFLSAGGADMLSSSNSGVSNTVKRLGAVGLATDSGIALAGAEFTTHSDEAPGPGFLGLGVTDSELPLEKIDLVSLESILNIMVSVCPS